MIPNKSLSKTKNRCNKHNNLRRNVNNLVKILNLEQNLLLKFKNLVKSKSTIYILNSFIKKNIKKLTAISQNKAESK